MKTLTLTVAAALSLSGCAALGLQPVTHPDGSQTPGPTAEVIAKAVDAATPFLGPWGLLASALLGTGGAVFTVGKTVKRIRDKKKASKPQA